MNNFCSNSVRVKRKTPQINPFAIQPFQQRGERSSSQVTRDLSTRRVTNRPWFFISLQISIITKISYVRIYPIHCPKIPSQEIEPAPHPIVQLKHVRQSKQLTTQLMEPGDSMPHPQGFSNNSYHETMFHNHIAQQAI